MLSPSRANPHLRKKILRRVNERFSVDYEEEQKKEEEEEKWVEVLDVVMADFWRKMLGTHVRLMEILTKLLFFFITFSESRGPIMVFENPNWVREAF